MVYDVNTRKLDQIPLLRGSRDQQPAQEVCGIHSARLNPSKTLLVTGAKNPNELAIYRLPTMDPLCVGEVILNILQWKRLWFFFFQSAHKDWLFDFCWLDDQFVVSGSRDSKLGLWKVTDDEKWEPEKPNYSHISPLALKLCKQGHKIRALAFNSSLREIAALSLNGYIHIWNAETFRQVRIYSWV